MGKDFQVIIIALVGNLQSSNFRITFGSFGDLLVDKARELTCLDADALEVFVEETHSSFGIVGDPVIGSVQFSYKGVKPFFKIMEIRS